MQNEEFAERFHTGMLDPVLVSLTFGKRGGNLPPRVIERFGAILRTWAAKDIFEEGMATTERGDENMRRHVQGMVVMLINNTMDMSTCGTHRATYVHSLLSHVPGVMGAVAGEEHRGAQVNKSGSCLHWRWG